jgi:periplasmic protein TonB
MSVRRHAHDDPRRGHRGLSTRARLDAWLARAPVRERLAVAGVASALTHYALFMLIAVGFAPVNPALFTTAQPNLEVVLLHQTSRTQPQKAEVLAQAAHDGGGQTTTAHHASSPRATAPPPAPTITPAPPAAQRVQALEAKVERLMEQARAEYAVPAPATPVAAATPAPGLAARSLKAVRELGRIEAEVSEYQQRPRRVFVGARAEEYVFARYIEDWRLKVERVGNLNYPEAARRQKVYGSLMLSVEIAADGRLLKVEVERSSGSRILDAAAIHIVEISAPYPAFNDAMRAKADILVINRVWSFTREERLQAQ